MATVLVKAAKSSAPGQYLGYGLQDVRLCRHLLKAPAGSKVSLEYIEDTAIHLPGELLLLEQAKSAISSNPLSDGAVDLWKTFANWGSLCADGSVNATATRFRLYTCPKKQGKLVALLHAAQTDEEAGALLTLIGKKVTTANQLKGCNPKISEFLSAGADICRRIILNFHLMSEDDPLEEIREVLSFAVHKDTLDDFCAHAIGSAKNQISALIGAGEAPVIDAEHFRKQLQAFIRKHGALGLLVPTTTPPGQVQVGEIVDAAPMFVRQLLCIGLSRNHIVRAVSDYLQSNADRIGWAADGRVIEESLAEFDRDLEWRYELARDDIEEQQGGREEDVRGRALYRRCVQHQTSLEGRAVPGYFVPGSYNMLADQAHIGWHPSYKSLISDDN